MTGMYLNHALSKEEKDKIDNRGSEEEKRDQRSEGRKE